MEKISNYFIPQKVKSFSTPLRYEEAWFLKISPFSRSSDEWIAKLLQEVLRKAIKLVGQERRIACGRYVRLFLNCVKNVIFFVVLSLLWVGRYTYTLMCSTLTRIIINYTYFMYLQLPWLVRAAYQTCFSRRISRVRFPSGTIKNWFFTRLTQPR